MADHSITDITGQIKRLEREITRLKKLVVIILVAIVVGALLRLVLAGTVADNIAARRFSLVDNNGTLRGALVVDSQGAANLSLLDNEGRIEVVGLRATGESSSGLRISDPGGNLRAALVTVADGSPDLLLFGRDGKPTAVLRIRDDAPEAVLTLQGRDGAKAKLSVGDGATPEFTFKDSSGKELWKMPLN